MTNDKEQLKGILKEFDLGDAKVVLNELSSDLMPKVSEFNNQGEKCSHGHDGCISKEEFERNQEAMWGENNFLSAHFLTEGAEIQKAIAMVTLKVAKGRLPVGNGWGSGFLISNIVISYSSYSSNFSARALPKKPDPPNIITLCCIFTYKFIYRFYNAFFCQLSTSFRKTCNMWSQHNIFQI